jgi:hypothetical protein
MFRAPTRFLRAKQTETSKLRLKDRFGSFTTDAFSTRADQCPLLLQ